jgi:hypothetical protein
VNSSPLIHVIKDNRCIVHTKGTIIECDISKGIKNYHYRLADNYRGKGYSAYKLKPQMQVLLKLPSKKMGQYKKNIICQNLIKFYTSTLPTLIEIEDEADRLISMNI